MKKIVLSASLLLTGISSAATPIDGWYTSVFGGFSYFPNNVNIVDTAGLLVEGASYNTGYNAGGRVGYQSHPLRYEFEYTYLSSSLNGFNINHIAQGDLDGSSSGSLLMANIYYDFPDMLPAISPFLGVGIGYATLETSLLGTSSLGTNYYNLDENEFAYQGTAGLTYNFSENYALNLSYRYAAVSNDDGFGKIFQSHIISSGIIYHFDRGYYK